MRCKIILLQVLSVSLVFAQDIEDQVSVFLSDTVSKNPSLKSTIYNQMRPNSEIHPELSYHYLRYLKTYYKIQSNQDIRAVNEFFNQAVQHYKLRRTLWAEHQIKEARRNLSYFVFNDIAPFFEKYIIQIDETPSPGTISMGIKNELNYMVYLYYRNDSTISFDPEQNYTLKRTEMETKIIDGFNEYYRQKLPNINYIDRDEIAALFRYWYLFSTDSSNELKQKIEFEPYEFISRFYRRQFNKHKFYISFRYGVYNSTYSYSLVSNMGMQNDTMKRKLHQKAIGLNYRYYVRDNYKIFSYLNLGFYFTINSAADLNADKTPVPYVLKYNQGEYLIIENLTYKYYSITGSYEYSLIGLISTPLVYFLNKSSVNISIYYGYSRFDYHHQFQYRYRKTENWVVNNSHYVRVLEDYTKKDNLNKVGPDYFVFPAVDFLIPLWLNLIFEVNLSYTYGALSISYKIH